MEDKKYTFHFTAEEILILILALNCAYKPVEFVGQGEISQRLLKSLQSRIDKIFGISTDNSPKKER